MLYELLTSVQAHERIVGAFLLVFAILIGLCCAEAIKSVWRRQ